MFAEVNVELELTFDCPHCDKPQRTSEHGLNYDITVGAHDLTCTQCGQYFELNINAPY